MQIPLSLFFHHVNVCHTVAAFGPSNTVIKLLSQCCFYCLNVYIVHMPSGSLPLLLLLLIIVVCVCVCVCASVCLSVRSFLPPRASRPRNIVTYVFTATRK